MQLSRNLSDIFFVVSTSTDNIFKKYPEMGIGGKESLYDICINKLRKYL